MKYSPNVETLGYCHMSLREGTAKFLRSNAGALGAGLRITFIRSGLDDVLRGNPPPHVGGYNATRS